VAGSCEYGDEPSGSGATELVGWFVGDVNLCNGRCLSEESFLEDSDVALRPTNLTRSQLQLTHTPLVVTRPTLFCYARPNTLRIQLTYAT
jgi:hypothetical protein